MYKAKLAGSAWLSWLFATEEAYKKTAGVSLITAVAQHSWSSATCRCSAAHRCSGNLHRFLAGGVPEFGNLLALGSFLLLQE
jgi:hypothetical protein